MLYRVSGYQAFLPENKNGRIVKVKKSSTANIT